MKQQNLIVFDMDGVLIDVSGSYREAVRKTARLFLEGAKNSGTLPEPLFSPDALASLKQTGGLNNDWDLTARTLELLFNLIEPDPEYESAPASFSCPEAIARLDVSPLAAFLRESGNPLVDLDRRFGRRKSSLVENSFRKDVTTGNVIKRMFQEIYLGPPLFFSSYGLRSCFSNTEGLINKETLLFDAALLEELASLHTLAIATGRPRVEAEHPLERFGIRKYFQEIITFDDCLSEEQRLRAGGGKQESLGKPHPFMLDLLSERIAEPFSSLFYIGDMPDDMEAARASSKGYRGVGVLWSSPDRESSRRLLFASGAEFVVASPAALCKLVAACMYRK